MSHFINTYEVKYLSRTQAVLKTENIIASSKAEAREKALERAKPYKKVDNVSIKCKGVLDTYSGDSGITINGKNVSMAKMDNWRNNGSF